MNKPEKTETDFDKVTHRNRPDSPRRCSSQDAPQVTSSSNGTSQTLSNIILDKQAIEIRQRTRDGEAGEKIASEMGLSQLKVFSCAIGLTHRHLNEKYPPVPIK